MRSSATNYTVRHTTQSRRRFAKWIKRRNRNRNLPKVNHWLARARLREAKRIEDAELTKYVIAHPQVLFSPKPSINEPVYITSFEHFQEVFGYVGRDFLDPNQTR